MLEQCRTELEETARHLKQKLTEWLTQEGNMGLEINHNREKKAMSNRVHLNKPSG
ncbi:hypothetical protein C2W64_02163 [Brevibacillus laterosporus]|nr:hypothetical protein C2W64_02163 [Brevibacillus laterosporus]